ncbi:hypothetical protein RCC89_18650 [Cytophagaceae bacterium ABcell3]|nr:hypothetical protein RCC89_18650 [Cytophagaceae bacterium ABcell3]
MNNIFLISALLLSSLALKDCSNNFVEVALDDSHQIAVPEDPEYGIDPLSYNKGILEDFTGEIWSWWTSGEKIGIQKVGDTLKLQLKEAGANYDCWGREFSRMYDMSEVSALKVRMRFEGGLSPMVNIQVKDMNGIATNMNPPQAMVKRGGFTDYYFDFNNKWKQIWPASDVVDNTKIREILFFVNPGKMNWTGTLYIDDIVFVHPDDVVDPRKQRMEARKKKEEARKAKEKAEKEKADAEKDEDENEGEDDGGKTNRELPETGDMATDIDGSNLNVSGSADPVMLDDFSEEGISDWWSGDRITLQQEENGLKVIADEAGPAFETFGMKFDEAINFNRTPVIRVRFKPICEKPGELRVDIKDMEGFSTNARPIVMKFESGTDFVEYYYNFTGRFEQSFPNVTRVNPNEIIEAIFFINPGGEPFTGNLLIDEIEAISLEEFNRVK